MRRFLGRLLIILGIVGLIIYVLYVFFLRNQPDIPLDTDIPPSSFGTPGTRNDDISVSPPTDVVDGIQDQPSDDTTPDTPTSTDLPDLVQVTDFPVTFVHVSSRNKERIQTVSQEVEFLNDDGISSTEVYQEDVLVSYSVPLLRYNGKLYGFLFETELDSSLDTTQLTDQVILQSEEGTVNSLGNHFVYRFYNEPAQVIQTYEALLSNPTESYSCPFSFSRTLRPGDQGPDVESLQLTLSEVGIPHDSTLVTPGIFDDETLRLVQAFQRLSGVSDDGIVGPTTQGLVLDECLDQIIHEQELRNQDSPQYSFTGMFREENIVSYAKHPTTDEVFYIAEDGDSVSGYLSRLGSSEKTLVYTLEFSEWIVDWVSDDVIFLTSKASHDYPGYSYTLNPRTGVLTRVLGDIQGLTALMSPDTDSILYSQSTSSGVTTSLYDQNSRSSRSTGFATLPEKCVWASDSLVLYCAVPEVLAGTLLPDTWYQGRTSFSDTLISYNIATGERTVLLSNLGGIDITHLELWLDDSLLTFIDNTTGHLYSYSLSDTSSAL